MWPFRKKQKRVPAGVRVIENFEIHSANIVPIEDAPPGCGFVLPGRVGVVGAALDGVIKEAEYFGPSIPPIQWWQLWRWWQIPRYRRESREAYARFLKKFGRPGCPVGSKTDDAHEAQP